MDSKWTKPTEYDLDSFTKEIVEFLDTQKQAGTEFGDVTAYGLKMEDVMEHSMNAFKMFSESMLQDRESILDPASWITFYMVGLLTGAASREPREEQ